MQEEQIHLPNAVFYYLCFKSLPIFLFLLILSGLNSNPIVTFLSLIIFFVGPIYLYIFIKLRCISWIVDENQITINSGIIVKESKSIALKNIQNANLRRGPIRTLFNLSNLDIWTASPDQFNVQKGNTVSSPSATLILFTPDAEWLKKFLLTPPSPITTQPSPSLVQESPTQQTYN